MNSKLISSALIILMLLTLLTFNLYSIAEDVEGNIRISIDGRIAGSIADWVLLINAKTYYVEGEDILVNLTIVRLGEEVEGSISGLSMYTCCSIAHPNGTIVYDPRNYLGVLGSYRIITKKVSGADVLYSFTWKPLVLSEHGYSVWHPRLVNKSCAEYVVNVNLSISEKRNNTWLLRSFTTKFPIDIYSKHIMLPFIPYPYNCTRIGVFLYGNWSIAIGHIGDKGFVNLTYIGKEPLRVKYLLHPIISHLEVVKIYENGKGIIIRELGYYVYNETELVYPGTSDTMEFKVEHNVALIYVKGKLPDNSTIRMFLPLKGKLRVFKYLYFKKPWIMECIGDWVIYIKRDYMIPRNVEPEVHVIFARINETPVNIQYFIATPYSAVDIYYPNGSIALRYRLPPGAIITTTIGRKILWNFTWKPSTLFEHSRTTLDPGRYIMHIKLWVDEIVGEKHHRFKTIKYSKKHILTVVSDDRHIHEYIGILYAGPWILKLTYIKKSLQVNMNLTYIGLTTLMPGHEITMKLYIYYPKGAKTIILRFSESSIEPNKILLKNITLSSEPMLIVLSSNNLPKYGRITLYLPILFKMKINEIFTDINTVLNVGNTLTTTPNIHEIRRHDITLILTVLVFVAILAPTLMAIYMLKTRTKEK